MDLSLTGKTAYITGGAHGIGDGSQRFAVGVGHGYTGARPGGIADRLAEMYGTDREAGVERYLKDRQLTLGLGEPQDVADLVAFLASPRARRISGSAFDVGGTIHGLY